MTSYIKTCYKISDFIFGRFSEKLKIIVNVMIHEWQMAPLAPCFGDEFHGVSEEEVNSTFHDLDSESVSQIKKYLKGVCFLPAGSHDFFFYNTRKFFTAEELKQRNMIRKELFREQKKYHFPRTCSGMESFLTHHGLRLLDFPVRDYLRDGNFIDAGCCFGDSALVFLKHYAPGKVYSFEPSESNRNVCKNYLKRNKINPEKIELVPLGLGAENETIFFHETPGESNSLLTHAENGIPITVKTLDTFCTERNLSRVKLIKADIEGMGMDMLHGAEKVIRENRPVMSLSIYHNKKELFGIYQTLQKWNLNYHYMVRMLAWPLPGFAELSLLAWPAELESK